MQILRALWTRLGSRRGTRLRFLKLCADASRDATTFLPSSSSIWRSKYVRCLCCAPVYDNWPIGSKKRFPRSSLVSEHPITPSLLGTGLSRWRNSRCGCPVQFLVRGSAGQVATRWRRFGFFLRAVMIRYGLGVQWPKLDAAALHKG